MIRRLTTMIFFPLLSLSLMLFGCVAMQEKKTQTVNITYHENKTSETISWPNDGLKEEFERYWSQRFAGDWQSTLLMEAPYFREMTPEKKYRDFIKAHAGNQLLGIEIWSVLPETDQLLKIRCEIAYEKGGEIKKFFEVDKWVRVQGGRWYHIIQDPILFPTSQ